MHTIFINTEKGVLWVEGFGEWALPQGFKDNTVYKGQLPIHESFCTDQFVHRVNVAIDKALTLAYNLERP